MPMHDEGTPTPKERDRFDAPEFEGIILPQTDEQGRPSVGFDWRRYEDLLSDVDITDDDKRKVVEALWSIVTGFIQLGFGVHPIQQACGKLSESEAERSFALLLSKEESKPENEGDDI